MPARKAITILTAVMLMLGAVPTPAYADSSASDQSATGTSVPESSSDATGNESETDQSSVFVETPSSDDDGSATIVTKPNDGNSADVTSDADNTDGDEEAISDSPEKTLHLTIDGKATLGIDGQTLSSEDEGSYDGTITLDTSENSSFEFTMKTDDGYSLKEYYGTESTGDPEYVYLRETYDEDGNELVNQYTGYITLHTDATDLNITLNKPAKKKFSIRRAAARAAAVNTDPFSVDWASVLDYAKAHFNGMAYGNPYDCSGLVSAAFTGCGVQIRGNTGRWTQILNNAVQLGQATYVDSKVAGNARDGDVTANMAGKGDIVIFYTSPSRDAGSSTHMGFMSGGGTTNYFSAIWPAAREMNINHYQYTEQKSGLYLRIYHKTGTPPVVKTYKPHITFQKTAADQAVYNELKVTSGVSLAGAEYAIYADAGRKTLLTTFTTDANGRADVHVNTGIENPVVYIAETKAPAGFIINSNLITVNLDANGNGSASQSEGIQKSEMGIRKVDPDGNDVAGAKLQLINSAGTVVHTWTSNGNAEKVDVLPGVYTVRELIPPKGYYPAPDQKVTLTPGQTSDAVMVDQPIGSYEVIKVDEDGNPVPGCVLALYGRENTKPNAKPGEIGDTTLFETWTTGTGYHKLGTGQLHNGWTGAFSAGFGYYIKEVSVPAGYELSDDPVVFTLNSLAGPNGNSTVKLKFNNKTLKYEFQKYDALTGQPLKGATMQLLDSNGNVKEEWVTDGEPHKIDKYNLIYGHRYYVHEAKAPAGYYYMSDDVSFEAYGTGGEYYDVTGYDYPIQLSAEKIDAESKDMIGGVDLTLCDEAGVEIYKWTSSNKKIEQIPATLLEPGKTYHIKESNTPDGYYPSTKETMFTVAKTSANTETHQPILIKIKNMHITVKVGKYSLEKDANGKKVNKLIPGAKLAVGTKDSSGKFTPVIKNIVSTDMPQTLDYHKLKAGQTYYLREIEAPENYYYMMPDENDSSDVAFTIPATQEDMEKDPNAKSGILVTGLDYPIQYEIMKTDENGAAVAGIHFGLFDKNNKELEEWYSGTSAHLITSKLTAGESYTVREMSAVNGYYPVGDTTLKVPKYPTDKKDYNKVISLKPVRKTIVNNHIDIRFLKVDGNDKFFITASDGSCAKFEIYDTHGTPNDISDDGDPVYTSDELSTDNAKYQLRQYFEIGSKLMAGTTYRIHEAVCPTGFNQAADQTFTVPTSKPDHNDPITIKDNSLQVRFTKITTDDDGKETTLHSYVDGSGVSHPFKFDVIDEDTKVTVFSFDTDDKQYKANGYIDIGSKLQFGKTYRIVETEYPVGYYRARDSLFTISAANSITTVKMSDPTIHAKFRKSDINGNALTDQNFKFQVVDTATNKSVAMLILNSKTVDKNGFVHFGNMLQEGHTYKIVEFEWPAKYKSADPITFTVPTYYQQD